MTWCEGGGVGLGGEGGPSFRAGGGGSDLLGLGFDVGGEDSLGFKLDRLLGGLGSGSSSELSESDAGSRCGE